MSSLGRLGVLVALALALFVPASLVAGCGTALDATKTEEQIKEEVENVRGTKVESVDCPSDVSVDPQTRFSCEVRLSDGKVETATLLIRDKDANLDFLKLQPAK